MHRTHSSDGESARRVPHGPCVTWSKETENMKNFTIGAISATAIAALVLAGGAQASTVVGLTTDNRLLTFDHLAPGITLSNVAVTGLGAGESLVGIDLRPATGQVFGVTALGIYDLNILTGAASLIGSGFTPSLDSAEYGIDFNPTVDRVRVVNSLGGNRRLNPANGTSAATDTVLAYVGGGTPRAVAVAYTNSVAAAAMGSIRELAIDSANDSLIEIGSQAGGNASFNGGVSTVIGSLGVDTGDLVGFDIFGPTGVALISTTPDGGGASTLRLLNLATGTASPLGEIAGGTIRDITIIPAPSAAMIGALAGLSFFRRRR